MDERTIADQLEQLMQGLRRLESGQANLEVGNLRLEASLEGINHRLDNEFAIHFKETDEPPPDSAGGVERELKELWSRWAEHERQLSLLHDKQR